MKVKKMLLREETEKVLHTKSNGDKLVAAASGDGYTAFTKDDVHIGHISAETDAAAIAEFSKKEPKYEALDMSLEELQRTADRYLDVEIDELMRTILEKTSSMSREQLSRLVKWCRNFYALLEEFASDNMTEGYMDTHEGVAHVDTLDLMAALKSVVREYGHMELATPVYCELMDDEHGRRLALNSTIDEGLVPDKIGGDINLSLDGSHSSVGFLGGTATNTNNGEEGDHDASNSHKEDLDEDSKIKNGKFAGNTINLNISPNMSGAASGNKLIDLPISAEVPVSANVPLDLGVDGASVGFLGGSGGQGGEIHDTTNESTDDDFMDAENMDMSEFDSHTGKLEDIEFVMTEYIADSLLIEFVKKVDATTWLVGVEDEVVTVKFDPSWSEYVYTIEGKGPYSHRSYEYISRDVYDFVMSHRTGNEYDDDFDDLSSFRECSEVKKADALYGVEERDELVEAVYTDTNGIMGIAGETYTTAELRKIWNDNHNDDPSMVNYNGDYDKWVSDTLAQMSRNDDVDEAFDMSYGPDLGKLSWQVASFLDVDALGEDNWIEFICDDPRDVVGGTKTMRFEAIGEDAHMYGFIRTNGDAVDVQFRNGSEAVCHSAEEVARFIAGEFGISI